MFKSQTSLFSIHCKRKWLSNYSINLKIHNNEIKENVKYLGTVMDCNLNRKDHVFELSKKISRRIGILFKLRDFVSIDILSIVYH